VGISTAAFYNISRAGTIFFGVYDYYRAALISRAPRPGVDLGMFPDTLDRRRSCSATRAFPVPWRIPCSRSSPIISMEKTRNRVAPRYPSTTRRLLVSWRSSSSRCGEGCTPPRKRRLLGRMFGYIQLGMRRTTCIPLHQGMEVDDIVKPRNDAMGEFLTELTGG